MQLEMCSRNDLVLFRGLYVVPELLWNARDDDPCVTSSSVDDNVSYQPCRSDADQTLTVNLQRFGTEVLFRDVTAVDLSSRPFKVFVRKREFQARQGHFCIPCTLGEALRVFE